MKTVCMLLLLFVFFIDLNGQWYTRKYGLTDINQLSKTQLEESFVKAKNAPIWGVGCIIVGGICIPIGVKDAIKVNEPGPLMHLWGVSAAFYIGVGACSIMYGFVKIVSSVDRRQQIKPLLDNYNKENGSLSILPAFLLNSYSKSYVPGFVLTLNF